MRRLYYITLVSFCLFYKQPAHCIGSVDLSFDPQSVSYLLKWSSDSRFIYSIDKTADLVNWVTLDTGIRADGTVTERAFSSDSIETEPPFYLRVRENAFVDPATPANAQPDLSVATGDNWVLEFSDEFNSLDAQKWNVTVSDKSRAPRLDKGIERWFWRQDHVSVESGNLVLKASKPDYRTMYCGSVDSKNLYEPTYGFMEARIQIAPIENAIHTAFWTQGHNMGNVDGSGADGAEVDIVETPFLADRAQTVLHWDGYGQDKKAKTNRWDAPGLHQGFHTFAMHWTETFIDVYYDGVFKWRYEGVGIPKVREWLWVSIGASFGDGDFQNGSYPSFAYVDYVRVWRSSPDNIAK